MLFLPPHFPCAVVLPSGKAAIQVPAIFAAIETMTAV
jgi:hypothetical protein